MAAMTSAGPELYSPYAFIIGDLKRVMIFIYFCMRSITLYICNLDGTTAKYLLAASIATRSSTHVVCIRMLESVWILIR